MWPSFPEYVLGKLRTEPKSTASQLGWIGFLAIPAMVWTQPGPVKILVMLFSAPVGLIFHWAQLRLAQDDTFDLDSLANHSPWTVRHYGLWCLEFLTATRIFGTPGMMISTFIWRFSPYFPR
jgi:hypothetical protein